MKIPAMKTPALATVYLDNANVGLMGDPRPTVSKIVAAGGKEPGKVQVVRAQSSSDQKGKPLGLADIIDRTADPTQPIYLRSQPQPAQGGPAGKDTRPFGRSVQVGDPAEGLFRRPIQEPGDLPRGGRHG